MARGAAGGQPQAHGVVPFPTRQLFVLGLCRICEPIAFMSIFPYIYFMVLSFNITQDERQVAIYAGMVTSAFALAEFSSGVFWGRLSDRVGRKPILLTGLAGTGVSMLVFGFSFNFPMALLARAVGGLLNGNMGVLNTAVAEVVTIEGHRPRAFSIMPSVWCLGSIIGAALGGALADPAKTYPPFFNPHGLFSRFPYLLPNLVCTGVVIFGLVVGVLFLEESHEDKKHRKDRGLELGRKIVATFKRGASKAGTHVPTARVQETDPVLPQVEKRLGYQSIDAAPTSLDYQSSDVDGDAEPGRESDRTQILLIVVGYGILALHTIALEQLLPILLSMPEADGPPTSLLKFTGGLALSTKTIGFILSSQGVLQILAQLLVFPAVTRKLGSLRTFRTIVFLYPIYYCLVPYLALSPRSLRYAGIYLVLVFKVTAQSLAFPSMQIMIANVAPSKSVLGTVNGFAASSASLARAFGPTLAGLVQSWGLSIGCSCLSWWSCSAVAIVGAAASLWMEDGKRTPRLDPVSRPGHEEGELAVSASAQHEGRA